MADFSHLLQGRSDLEGLGTVTGQKSGNSGSASDPPLTDIPPTSCEDIG
ncbi:hypothetical protein QWY16_08385 [Planococcus shenhongbingii]|nr:hypothetical protein [Planococcus sp. N016]WKA60112.1 hypothetical protein QWY16_08385 [Planococcus sp. N016]